MTGVMINGIRSRNEYGWKSVKVRENWVKGPDREVTSVGSVLMLYEIFVLLGAVQRKVTVAGERTYTPLLAVVTV